MSLKDDTTMPDATDPAAGRWIAMATLLVASFMNMIDVTIVNVAVPSLQHAFNATASQIEWVVAAYTMTFAVCLLPFGRMGDIYGRRKVFLAGVILFTLASALCGMAHSMPMLILSRVVQGVGGAMMVPQTLAIAQVLFAPHERAAAFSLFGLTAGLASVSGPVLGGFLIDSDIAGMGWRPIFLVNIPIGVIAVLGALRFIPDLSGDRNLRTDPAGILLAGITVFLLLFPLIEGREFGWPVWIFVMLAMSIPAGWAFVTWEHRQEQAGAPQLLPVQLLRNRNFVLGTALSTVLFSGIPGFFLVLAIYLQVGNGLTPLQSGLTTMPFSIGVLIASIISGRIGMKWPRRRISAGAVLLIIAMVWVRWAAGSMGADFDRIRFALPLLAGGIGLGIAISPMFQTVLSNVPPRDAGSGSGALQAFQQAGGALGVALVGQIFFSEITSRMTAGEKGAPVFASALSDAMLYNIIAFALIAVLVRLLPKPAQRPQGAMQAPPVEA